MSDSAQDKPDYIVDQLAHVVDKLKDLLARMPPVKRRQAAEALDVAMARLRSDPLGWGEAAFRTIKDGGLVCLGVARPFGVQYVAFEKEKVVCILDINILSGFAEET
ncbi:MAG: hypothetical protein U0793_14910 [Gemmataceae bacterium]